MFLDIGNLLSAALYPVFRIVKSRYMDWYLIVLVIVKHVRPSDSTNSHNVVVKVTAKLCLGRTKRRYRHRAIFFFDGCGGGKDGGCGGSCGSDGDDTGGS